MNDRQAAVRQEDFPVPAELLANPSLRHRYYDSDGKLLPVEELRRIENLWKSQGPPGVGHKSKNRDWGF